MPAAAIRAVPTGEILPLAALAPRLIELSHERGPARAMREA
jgi:hypothetical protein